MEPPRLAFRTVVCLLLLVALSSATAQALRVDGSSTLHPALVAVAAELAEKLPDTTIELGFSGTGGGFDLFCRGAAQIIGASRLASAQEREACAANGVEFVVVPVALDAVIMVVNQDNDWALCLTLDELRRMWRSDSSVERWSDLRPDWPSQEIHFYAPGVASGTNSFWNERVVGEPSGMRTDFFPSEDDRWLAQSVATDLNAVSFFGRAYVVQEADRLRAVAVDDGMGCIDPASLARPWSSRWPFIRPLFLYLSMTSAESQDAVTMFVELFLSQWGQEQLTAAGYLPLGEGVLRASRERFRSRVTGPLPAEFSGKALLMRLPGN
ncbi:MAG: substrate-binding domain-containing protein [Trueperaceae bacterium]